MARTCQRVRANLCKGHSKVSDDLEEAGCRSSFQRVTLKVLLARRDGLIDIELPRRACGLIIDHQNNPKHHLDDVIGRNGGALVWTVFVRVREASYSNRGPCRHPEGVSIFERCMLLPTSSCQEEAPRNPTTIGGGATKL